MSIPLPGLLSQVPLEKERVRLLLSGLATHHAGLLPVYKALIEELFNDNLVKVNTTQACMCMCRWLAGDDPTPSPPLPSTLPPPRWCLPPRRWPRA